ncbi:MAG: hypothetical protein ACI9FB_000019 [Candidatus Azotimanducaceae bacterium]|jgi:hypothetical protein
MRFIADFVMRGKLQAIGVSLFGALFPMMYWLSCATVSLVILRKGVRDGLLILLWASLPTVVLIFVYEDPTPMLVLLGLLCGNALLAFSLRATESWEVTMVVAIFVSGFGTLLFEYGAAGMMSLIVDQYLQFLTSFKQQLGAESAALAVLPTLEEAHELLFGSIAMFFAYFMLLILILGRWWQSELFNEGGFGVEFQSLRLSPQFSLALVLGLIASYGLDGFVRWVYILTMPLFIAAIGFVHWIVKQKKLASPWLVTFYLSMVLMFQLVAPVMIMVALMDSWFDLRKRTSSDREVE